MAISVETLSEAIGARISGVDLGGGLDDATMNDIRQVWLDHFVVVIPGQDMAGDDQIAFTEWFGPRQEVRTVKVVDEGPQNFMYVANKSVDGMDGVLPRLIAVHVGGHFLAVLFGYGHDCFNISPAHFRRAWRCAY